MITLDVPEGGEVLVHDSDAIFDFVGGVPLFGDDDDVPSFAEEGNDEKWDRMDPSRGGSGSIGD